MDLPAKDSPLSNTLQEEENSKAMECPVCQQQATKTCSACKSVAYCCVDHQRLDWKNHKNACQPFIIKETEDMGLGWFATRDLKVGVVLIEEFPALQAPDWTDVDNFGVRKCLTCTAKMQSMRACSTCSWPVCSEQCEKNLLHMNNECKELAFKKLEYPPPPWWPVDMLLTCMRAKSLKAQDPQKFQQLMALQDFDPFPPSNQELQTADLPLGMFEVLSGSNSLSRDEFRKLLRICTVNGHPSAGDGAQQQANVPVYLKASRINQSCFPNCTAALSPDLKLKVCTLIPVPKSEQLTLNFCDNEDFSFQSTFFRQTEFRNNGLICKCKRCRDPTELGTFFTGIKCFNCSSEFTADSDSNDDNNTAGYFLPANPLVTESPDPEMECHRCHVKCPTSQVMATLPLSLKNVLHDILMLTLAKPVDPKSLDNLLTRYEEDPAVNGYLHKNYWTILGATRVLIKIQIKNLDGMTKEELERLVRRLEFRLSVGDLLYPGSGFNPKQKDLKMMCDAAAYLGKKFSSGMSNESRLKLALTLNKSTIELLEAKLLQDDDLVSQEEKAKCVANLKAKKIQHKLLKERPDLNIVFSFN